MDPNTSHNINKDRGNFNLSNKFEYGHDSQGGAKSGKVPDDPKEMGDCHIKSKVGHG
jgi:hypothetical protein